MTQEPGGAKSTRRLLSASAGLFAVSSIFPVVASVLPIDRLPKWVGVVDVVIAADLMVLGMVIVSRKPSEFSGPVVSSALRIYRGLASMFLVCLVLFFIAGDSIRWSILLPGLAWRGWLLVMVLPSWLSLWPAEPH